MRGIALTAMLFALLSPSQARSESKLPTVVVEGESAATRGGDLYSRGMESSEDSSGFVEVIDTGNVWRGFETVGELLGQSVGVQLRSSGGRDDFATLSVRGSRAAQVKILLDGVSMSRADNQVVNLADLPMDSVERIEIYRGFTPVGFASSGAASVVNIITRKSEKAEAGGSLSYGSFASAKLSAHAAVPLASASVEGFVTAKTTDGDYDYVDDNGTLDNPDDDSVKARRNNASDSADLLLRYRRELPGGSRLTLRDNAFYKHEGLPGMGTGDFEALDSKLETLRNVAAAAWKSKDGDLGVEADFTYLDQALDDPRKPGRERLGLPYEKARNETAAATVSGRWSREIGPYNFVETSVESAYEVFDGKTFDRISGDGWLATHQERNSLAAAVGDEIWIPRWSLALALQLRHERVWNRFEPDPNNPQTIALTNSEDSSTDPRLGLRWGVTRDLSLKANLATYFRPPGFGELFGDQGFSLANPDLKPESGINRDVGMLWQWRGAKLLDRLDFEYAYFNNDIEDVIVVARNSNRLPEAINIADARVRGHELRLEAAAKGGVSLSANYTYQDSENLSSVSEIHGKELPGVPSEEAHLLLSLRRAHWGLSYEAEFTGAHFTTINNSRGSRSYIGSRLSHNLELALGPYENGIELVLEVDNLCDTLVPDLLGFPIPGRSWYLTVSYAWEPANQ